MPLACSPKQRVHETGNLSIQEISSITSAEPNPAERLMLESLNGIEGLMLEKEALALYRICKQLPGNAKILEIGSYQGGSTLAMGHAIADSDRELYCLDPWSNYLEQGDFADFERSKISDDFRIINNFIRNTAFIGDNLRMLRGKSSAFAGMLAGTCFDFIFIDGAHDYESVRTDIKLSFSALKPGGLICGHDYHNHGHGVVRAVTELLITVPSIITGTGVIEGTHIWAGIIPEPEFEFIMTDISDLCNAGYFEKALEKARTAYDVWGKKEILSYLNALEAAVSKKKLPGLTFEKQ
jgi:predicted O-methyltransferase YrrM